MGKLYCLNSATMATDKLGRSSKRYVSIRAYMPEGMLTLTFPFSTRYRNEGMCKDSNYDCRG